MFAPDEFKNALEKMTACHQNYNADSTNRIDMGELRRSLNEPILAQSYTIAPPGRSLPVKENCGFDASANGIAKSLTVQKLGYSSQKMQHTRVLLQKMRYRNQYHSRALR